MDFSFGTSVREGVFVVSLFGEFDLAAAETLPDLSASLDGHRGVEVDLRGLTFMDSTGLRTLIYMQKASSDRSFALRCESGSIVERVFELTGLKEHFVFLH